MLMTMFKGALAPTISLAIYESTPVARTYSTIGYLIAIISVLSFPILPRSKFLQTMILNIPCVCIAAALTLLQIYCSVQARAHTTPKPPPSSSGPSPGAAVSHYNSSASAVCAIWLFFNIYLISTFRAARPQLKFPAIMFSIFVNVASVYAPSFPTMSAGISFTERLLEAFLTGMAVATGTSLLVFPTTVRMTFFKQSAGLIQSVQGTLKAQITYLQNLEKTDIFVRSKVATGVEDYSGSKDGAVKPLSDPEAQKLKASIAGIGELSGKIHADLPFAKREATWGKMDASDISEMWKLMQDIILPLTGMSSVTDIFERIAERWGWMTKDAVNTPAGEELAQERRDQWNEILKTLHAPFETMSDAISDGLQHTLYSLDLAKAPRSSRTQQDKQDIEANAGVIKPGEAGYVKVLEQRIRSFYENRKSTLVVLCRQRGVILDEDAFDSMSELTSKMSIKQGRDDGLIHLRNQRQLYLVLYVSD